MPQNFTTYCQQIIQHKQTFSISQISNLSSQAHQNKKISSNLLLASIEKNTKDMHLMGNEGKQNSQHKKMMKNISKISIIKKIKGMENGNMKESSHNSTSITQKKVKFEETWDEQPVEKKKRPRPNEKEIAQEKNTYAINRFYQKLLITNEGLYQRKQKSMSFLAYICHLLGFSQPKKEGRTQIERQLLRLNRYKITGQKYEELMISQIYKKLLHQQTIQENNWTKLGFKTNKPLEELAGETIGLLTLLQWYSFIHQNIEQSEKIYDFFVVMNCSLLNFHTQATQIFCSQLEECKMDGKNWREYQEWYNILVKGTFKDLRSLHKHNPQKVKEQMYVSLEKCGSNLNTGRKRIIKKK